MENNINTSVTIGATASIISVERDNNNGKRASISVINTSTGGETISLAVDSPAVVGAGIVLSPGGVWSDSRDGNYWPTQKNITAIGSGAGAKIALQERVVTL